MWGISYDEYMMLHDASTLGSGGYDFVGFGTDGRVYSGYYLFASEQMLYVATQGRVRALPKGLLQELMADELIYEEIAYELPGDGALN